MSVGCGHNTFNEAEMKLERQEGARLWKTFSAMLGNMDFEGFQAGV